MIFLHGLLTSVGLTVIAMPASAQNCPPAGASYVIKGFTGDTRVTATGAAFHAKRGCKWNTEDGRELWWKMGQDVVVAAKGQPAKPAAANDQAAGKGASLVPGRVYTCNLPGIGLFTGAYFGIVNASTYRNFDGKTGRYSFDPSTGVLRMTSGSSNGLAYKRMPEGNFRVLDQKGNVTGGNCVHVAKLRIDGRW
jgi:hypothetical protein